MPKKTSAPKKPRGRPRGETPPPPVTGVRIPAEVLVALDAIVERRAAAMAPQGGTTSRNAIIVTALREFIERDAAGGAP